MLIEIVEHNEIYALSVREISAQTSGSLFTKLIGAHKTIGEFA